MMTLTKIAKEAHVSVSTASKAFSGSPEVSEETRELVFRVARDHGCFKKFYNAKYPKLVVAVIAPEFSSLHYSRYLSLIQRYLPDCELCVSAGNFSAECEANLLDYYYKHSNVDAVILIDPTTRIPEKMEIPVAVLRGRKPAEERLSHHISVCTDYRPAMMAAFSYLKDCRVNSVIFLGEEHTGSKEKLFCTLAQQAGFPVGGESVIRSSGRFEEGGYQAAQELLSRGAPPRALICAYDNMAIGAVKCLVDSGYRVPEDVAVLGMDDLPEGQYLNPPLASVSAAADQRCRLVAEAILRCISGETGEMEYIVPASFHLRRSFCIDK